MEEIIIDGVDVSGCNYYEQIQGCHGIRHCCSLYADKYGDYTIDCGEKETENCYYKQLKRKEKECEELKKEHDMLEKAIANILPTYQECIGTAEDDMLCGILDRHASEAEFCVHVLHETRNKIKNLFNENIKLKQALREIKEICIKQFRISGVKMNLDINSFNEQTIAKDILQKINEVENE